MKKTPKFIIPLIFVLIALIIFLSKSTINIGAGRAGVLFKTFGGGVVTEKPPLGEGFHIIAPWNDVIVYNVKQQEILEKMSVLSSNGLDIKLEATVWFQPNYGELGLLHQKRGTNYVNDVIKPAIRSAARSVVGRYTPEQIYSSKRDAIQKEIFEETKAILDHQYIKLNAVLVRDVSLPLTIKTAIERKLKQEQESLEYEFRIIKERKEAERKRIEAKGIKDFQDIVSNGISEKLLKWKGIEATLDLAKSPNAKVVIIGSGKEGMPIILGNN